MLLPLPENRLSGAPRPWATYMLLALCTLVFVPVQFSHRTHLQQGLHLLARAEAYHRAHSYLELDPRLGRALGRRQQGKGEDFRALEQAELDGLTGAGFDDLHRLPYWRWGVIPAHLWVPALLGHLFLHAGWLPLLGNLLVLWFVGSYLESRWPAALVGGCFLLGGVAAAGVFVLRYPAFPMPLIGASAAVASLLGALVVTQGREPLAVGYWFGSSRVGTVRVSAFVLLAAWGARELLVFASPEVLVPMGGAAGVVLWNHLAGLLAGALAAAALRCGGLGGRLGVAAARARAPAAGEAGGQAVARARAAWQAGRTGEAWQTLLAAARAGPADLEAADVLWQLALEEGRAAEAAGVMLRLVHHLSCPDTVGQAYQRWAAVRDAAPAAPRPVALELRLAQTLQSAGREREGAEVLAAAAARVSARELPRTLGQLALLLPGTERQRVAHLALAHPDLPPAQRAELEALLAASAPGPAPAATPTVGRPGPAVRPSLPAGAPLQVVYAVPVGIQQGCLGLELAAGGRRVLPLATIRGVAGAAVYDGGVEPDYILDLVLKFPAGRDEPASVIRFHSGRFDPSALVPTEPEVGDALLSFAGQLLVGGGALWLLGAQATELRSYDSPAAHQTELLAVLRLNAGAA